MRKPYRRYEDVEFIIPANLTAFKVAFVDIPQLRSDTTKEILICSARAFTQDECPLSFNQNPLLPESDLIKCFLTLYVDGEESIFRIPCGSLRNTYVGVGSAQAGNSFWSDEIMEFDFLSVDWTKSYITLSALPASAALQCILFSFGYLRCKPGTLAAIQKVRDNAAQAGVIQQM